MRIRVATMFVLAAALSLEATAAFAQRARSTTRIPVSKEAPGEVIAPKVDTVRITEYRTDTLRLPGVNRIDTVRTTVTRYDTTRVETLPMQLNRVGGLYFGVGLGESNAHGSIEIGQSAGLTAQAQLGWQGATTPFGLRLDANYARFGEERQSAGIGAHPDVLNVSGDLKLGLNFLNAIFGYPRFGFYAVGGPTYTRYKELRVTTGPEATQTIIPTDGAWHDKFGFNVGGGAGIGWGKTELFIESRYFAMTPTSANGRASQIPIIIGFNWY